MLFAHGLTGSQAGDDYILVSYGEDYWDINIKGRVGLLQAKIGLWNDSRILGTVGCHISQLPPPLLFSGSVSKANLLRHK